MKRFVMTAMIIAVSMPAFAGGGGSTVPVEGLRDTLLYTFRVLFGW